MQAGKPLRGKGIRDFELMLGPPSHVDGVAMRWDRTALGAVAVDKATCAWLALRNFAVHARGSGLDELVAALRRVSRGRRRAA